MADNAPELVDVERRRYPPIDRIAAAMSGKTTTTTVPIPIDCTDGFTEALYARPERMLDPELRAAQSAWGLVAPDVQHRAVAALAADLESGEWDRRYGHLRNRPTSVRCA